MILEKYPELVLLSPREKLRLVEELWDNLETVPNEGLLAPEQIAELNRRLDDFERDPNQGTPWETVRKRVLGQTTERE